MINEQNQSLNNFRKSDYFEISPECSHQSTSFEDVERKREIQFLKSFEVGNY